MDGLDPTTEPIPLSIGPGPHSGGGEWAPLKLGQILFWILLWGTFINNKGLKLNMVK